MAGESRYAVGAVLRHVQMLRDGVRRNNRLLRRMIEALEPRKLLTLSLQGTPGDDEMVVHVESDNRVQLSLNGQIFVFNPPDNGNAEILGFGGNDDIWLQNTNDLDFYITGHDGDDFYTVGNGQLEVDIEANVSVVDIPGPGQGGNDQLLFNDALGFNDGSVIVIRTGRLLLPATLALPLLDFNLTPEDRVTIQGSLQDDEYFVEGLRPNMTVNMGADNDKVHFGGGHDRLDYAIPPNVTFDGGTGTDRMTLVDVNSESTTGSIFVDEDAMLGGIPVSNFDELFVNTGTPSGGTVQPVVFTGDISPAYAITIWGGQGTDEVYIGTLSDRVDADSFADHFTLELSGGVNKVEIHNQFGNGVSGQGWLFKDTGLESSIGQMSLSSNTPLSLTLRGTFGPDTFTVFDAPDDWNIHVEGSQGNDLLQMALNLDLDDVFDGSSFEFIGGSGDDTLSLSDIHDQLGDFDEYVITGEFIKKGDPGVPSFSFISTDFISHLIFTADNDPNNIIYDVASYQVAEIYGADGADTFINKASGLVPSSFLVNSLAPLTQLFGGSGADILTIDDSTGGLANYEMNAGVFLYLPDTRTFRLDYDSFETIDFLASNQPNTISVRSKPSGSQLTIQGRNGDDTFIVGGGDIDASGISSSNTTLLAGSGNDHITFDDRIDNHDSAFDGDTFSFHFQQVIKDSTTILYGGFESQKLQTSGVNTAGPGFPNKVRINAIDIPTEVEGTAGVRDNTVDIGTLGTNLTQIFAPITLSFQNAPVVVSVNDQNTLADRIYAMSATGMSLPVVVNYAGVEEMYLYAGSGHDELSVSGTPMGMNVFFNGGIGDEIMALGIGATAFSNLAGRVFASGGSGTDQLFIVIGAGSGMINGVLTSGSFMANGGPNHLYQAEQVELRLNDDGSNLTVNALSAPTVIEGGAGNDSVTIGGGDLNDNIPPVAVQINSNGGVDRLVINDANDVNPPATSVQYRVEVIDILSNLQRFQKITGGSTLEITTREIFQWELHTSNDANNIHVLETHADLRINSNGGDDLITVTDANGLVTINTGAGLDAVTINDDSAAGIDGAVFVKFDSSDDINSLDVRANGYLVIGVGAVLLKTAEGPSQAFALNGTIVLSGGAMLFRAAANVPSQSAFRTLLSNGYNSGFWNGESPQGAINSHLASETFSLADGVGYGIGSELSIGTLGAFTVNPTDVVLRYALDGDSNLNGGVNALDFNALATNFGISSATWVTSDFNYDNVVNTTDFNALAMNFNKSGGITPSTSDLSINGRVTALDFRARATNDGSHASPAAVAIASLFGTASIAEDEDVLG